MQIYSVCSSSCVCVLQEEGTTAMGFHPEADQVVALGISEFW